jgi:L-alanine-DL-glutamate epimerase-like enolase superfamily enzyme
MWSGESAESAKWLVDEVFAPWLKGAAFDHPCEVQAELDRLTYGNPFTKSALDTAFWDLWARQQGKPVSALIADRPPFESIPTRASIGTYPAAQTAALAAAFWADGIRTLKFKIGMTDAENVERLRIVRETLGDEPVFTVDANGAYATVDDAVRAVEAMLPYSIALIEQPTTRERLSMMAEFRRRVDVPLMVDEGVFTPAQLDEALALEAFDVLSVYPGKNGGFTHALEMVKTAAAAGKTCAIGCNLETDIGQAAMATLTTSLSAFPVDELPSDLPAAVFYEQSSVAEPLELVNGRVTVPTEPGFGVEPRLINEQ